MFQISAEVAVTDSTKIIDKSVRQAFFCADHNVLGSGDLNRECAEPEENRGEVRSVEDGRPLGWPGRPAALLAGCFAAAPDLPWFALAVDLRFADVFVYSHI